MAERLSEKEMKILVKEAGRYIPGRVDYYARIIGVTYNKVSVKKVHSRWGSCSSEGNLNFNCMLMLCPKEVIDSVIVHELCHRIHMNHSKEFYECVLKFCPDYYESDKWLKENGVTILAQMPIK